jgi:glycopeptide antibiotics resistance protein
MLRPTMSWVAIGAVAAALSSALEALQFLTGVGVADVSDVISNTGGALIGGILAVLLQAALPRRAGAVMLVTAVVATCVVGGAIALHGADPGLSPGASGSISGSLRP